MSRLEQELTTVAAWALAFARATGQVLLGIAVSVRARVVAISRAVKNTYLALVAALVHSVVETFEFILAFRYAVLILLVPVGLAWAAFVRDSGILWILDGAAWLVIIRAALATPSHYRAQPNVRVLGDWARRVLASITRLTLHAFFVAASIWSLWRVQHWWLPTGVIDTIRGRVSSRSSANTESPASSTPRLERLAPSMPIQVDTLGWIISIRGYRNLDSALRLADYIISRGVPAFVSAETYSGNRWWDVLAGPASTADGLDSMRVTLGLRVGEKVYSDMPYSFTPLESYSRDSALAQQTRLRAAGLPSFVLGQADGRFRIYVGAFWERDIDRQTAALAPLLAPLLGSWQVAVRVGFVP